MSHVSIVVLIIAYQEVMIIGAGIGVTPVSATLKSIIHHRWKFSVGKSFPDHAYFYFVCSHRDIDSFRWFVRVLKDADDAVHDAYSKRPEEMRNKSFEFHLYVTSVPQAPRILNKNMVPKDDSAFWGRSVIQESRLERVAAPWTEIELLAAMVCPHDDGIRLGNVRVYKGRPKWAPRFSEIAVKHRGNKVGVAFCGNPKIGKDLKALCAEYSDVKSDTFFNLHKENFG